MSRPTPIMIEVSRLEELIPIASAMHASIINIDEEKKIAFVFLTPIATLNPIIYYCRLDKPPEGKYAHFNRISGRIRFSDELSTEPNEVSILIARVKAGSLLGEG